MDVKQPQSGSSLQAGTAAQLNVTVGDPPATVVIFSTQYWIVLHVPASPHAIPVTAPPSMLKPPVDAEVPVLLAPAVVPPEVEDDPVEAEPPVLPASLVAVVHPAASADETNSVTNTFRIGTSSPDVTASTLRKSFR